MTALLAPVATALMTAFILVLVLRRVASWLGLVDVPGGRKTHHGEVPVIGGIATFFGALAAVLVTGEGVSAEIEVLVAAGLMVTVGALDDRFDLRPRRPGTQTCGEPQRQVNIVACGSADLRSTVVSIGEISRAQSGKSRRATSPPRSRLHWLVNGTFPMRADRGHFHHRLLDAGFSVRAVFLLHMVASSVSVITGFWLWHTGVSEAVLFGVFVAVSVLWCVATHNARRLLAFVPRSLRRGEWTNALLPRRARPRRD